MQSKIIIDNKNLQQLKTIRLHNLKQIIDSGVVQLDVPQLVELPAHQSEVYLFLRGQESLRRKGIINDEYVVGVIDQIILKAGSIGQTQNIEDVEQFLNEQLLEAIDTLYPSIYRRYAVASKLGNHKSSFSIEQRKQQAPYEQIKILFKNKYGVGNALNLYLRHLYSFRQLKLSSSQILEVLDIYILPFYFEADPKQFLGFQDKIRQLLKQLMAAFSDQHFQAKLSTLFTQMYRQFWKQSEPNSLSLYDMGALERHFTLLELIHSDLAYNRQLLESKPLRSHIKSLLMFRGQNKSNMHLLAVTVFQKLAKLTGSFNSTSKTFINLFNILSSYGVHLIKDVWPSFYGLLAAKEDSVFRCSQLLELILWKLQAHQNSNVIKHCLHDLLKHTESNKMFQADPALVYNTLIPMLNLGVHYLDSLFHMDSKMYELIADFFLKFYNHLSLSLESLQKHLTWLLQSILRMDNYDHALIALILIFPGIKRKTEFLSLDLLERMSKLCNNAYGRYPIRKRYQMVDSMLDLIANHRNLEQVGLEPTLSFLINLNEQYMIQPKREKMKSLLNLFEESIDKWIADSADQIVLQIKMNVSYEKQDYLLDPLLLKIKKLSFLLSLWNFKQTSFLDFIADMLLDYGESQYKSAKQRYFAINAYYELHQLLLTNHFSFNLRKQLDSVLNLIAMFSIMKMNQQERTLFWGDKVKNKIVGIVQALLMKVYRFEQRAVYSERVETLTIVARMLEWAFDNIREPVVLEILITALRTRISILREKIKSKEAPIEEDENLFEQTLYHLYDLLRAQAGGKGNQQNHLSVVSIDKKLRMKVLLMTILMHDSSSHISKHLLGLEQMEDIIDCYDFQSYQEICWLIESIYLRDNLMKGMPEQLKTMFSDEFGASLAHSFSLLLEGMVHSLEYSLQKKEILGITESMVGIFFSFVVVTKRVNRSLVQFLIKLIQVGERYLIFQRSVALSVIEGLSLHFQDISKTNCEDLMPLLVHILSIEQYRGFDSAVYCYTENSILPFYRDYSTSLEYNYYGSVPRFLFIFTFRQLLQCRRDGPALAFYDKILHTCLQIALVVVGKQKMFLSGKNKLKMQMWQFLLVFDPELIFLSLGEAKFHRILIRCIQHIGHNSISQLRYYAQLFLMRILLKQQLFHCIRKQILEELKTGLLSSFGNVSRSVAFIVTSGLLIRHILRMSERDYDHFMSIKQEFSNLYNALLTYVCSSVAYFRGLSQYFCLQLMVGCLQTKYVSILRQNYLLDPEAKVLKQKLSVIIESYWNDIDNWNIETQLLHQVPTENNNVVCNHYYIDVLKSLATELCKVTKNQDGFTAYRNIWKKNVMKEQQDIEEEEEEKNEEEKDEQENGVFQRKIDLTIDLVHGNQTGSHLKIMIASAKSEVLIGHLARTGQIFGVEELIIPSLKTIQLDSFKSISVTAERWLNITELGIGLDPKSKSARINEVLISNKSEGYRIVKLSKRKSSQKQSYPIPLSHRVLLILDEQQCFSAQNSELVDSVLGISKYFSLHVEASIFIWQYFKCYLGKK